jgi:outer membrane protein insertion porin family
MIRRLALAAALIACAASGLADAAAAAGSRIAILPVVVHSLEEQAYLRDGLADMLASRLGQRAGIGVIRIGDPNRATSDPEAARAAARSAGADWVLFGSFTRFGEGASLDLRCLPVAGGGEGDGRSIFVQAGALGEIIPRLDSVADRVAAHVQGKPQAASPPGAAAPAAPPAGSEAMADALSELEELRRRVDALEGKVFGSDKAAQ